MPECTEKVCSKCREALPASEFHKNAAHPTGLQAYCKSCSAAALKRNREKNPERVREHGRNNMRKRRELDPERVAEYQREWRSANPDKVRTAKAAWEAANYDRVRIYSRRANRKFKARNRERVRVENAAWAKANPDKVAAKSRRWRLSHPLKVRAVKSRRRALIRTSLIGNVDLDLLWIRQCGTCSLCFERIDRALAWPDPLSKSVDHIVPLSKGGTHEQSNLAWTHLVCNLKKGASVPNS